MLHKIYEYLKERLQWPNRLRSEVNRRDKLCDQYYEKLQEALVEQQIKDQQLLWYKHEYEDLQKRYDEIKYLVFDKHKLEEKLKEAQEELTKKEDLYNVIDLPTTTLKEIEIKLKMVDKITVTVIIEYLKLDAYELVKNLAKVTSSENASNIIAYRDWALSRIQALIEKLSSLKTIDSQFKNRIVWEMDEKKI